MKPFTDNLAQSLEELNTTIEKAEIDDQIREQLFDCLDNVVGHVEAQVMLMFENWEIMEEEKREALLKEREKYVGEASLRGEDLRAVIASSAISPRGGAASPKKQQAAAASPSKKGKNVEESSLRALNTALYICLEALATTLKAERASVMIHHKLNNTLKSVCTVPAHLKKQQLPSHSGVVGMVYSSGVAFNAVTLDEEAQLFLKPVDQQTGCTTKNMLVLPIRDANHIVGVLELCNKLGGASPFDEHDERAAFTYTHLLLYFFTHYPRIDYINNTFPACQFDPSQSLHILEPWQPVEELVHSLPNNIKNMQQQQAIFRTDRGRDLNQTVKTIREHDKTDVLHLAALKEIYSYLSNLEESYRQGLNQFVQADKERRTLSEELQKKAHKIRVLEENVSFLETTVRDLKLKMENHYMPHPPSHAINYGDFKDKDGRYLDPEEEELKIVHKSGPSGMIKGNRTKSIFHKGRGPTNAQLAQKVAALEAGRASSVPVDHVRHAPGSTHPFFTHGKPANRKKSVHPNSLPPVGGGSSTQLPRKSTVHINVPH
eukprot:TRINITY_DN3909_c0_g1_i1.p1 TRINITY_DN3909_c0_g1~~TRINITY_DN3909_c0_g1_i1.p1  ORF type:complete len:546 (-),score=71.39 TRINITY_DN3909_c0_g1_i1:83-1720(-)